MRQKILFVFLKGELFHINLMYLKQKNKTQKKNQKRNQKKNQKKKHDFKKFVEHIENESKDINYDLFKHYFDFSAPSAQVKQLYETKSKNKNNQEQME